MKDASLQTSPSRYFLLCILFLLVSMSLGCRGFIGSTVPRPSRISLLDQDTGRGVWQTEDLTLSYAYSRDRDLLRISGEGTLYRRGVRYFNLSLYFVDAEGTVIGSTGVLSAVGGGPVSFQTEKTVPQGTRSFAFGYTGESVIRELGGIPFWYYPFGGT